MNSNSQKEQNISVIIRIKGKESKGLGENSSLIKVEDNNKILIEPDKKPLSFDYVGKEDSKQKDIFEHCGRKLCDDSLEGYNATIFAYGQTGSGKTYTILGKNLLKNKKNKAINRTNKKNFSKITSEDLKITNDSNQNNNNIYSYNINDENIGLLPRILYYLFEKSNTFEKEENKFLFKISYLEIYNDFMKDLLNPDNNESIEFVDINGKNFRKLIINSPEEAIIDITRANIFRHKAKTLMNNESSRSHAIITIYIENKLIKENKIKKSVFHIIDLAGSEKIKKTGERSKEGGKINQSLLFLSYVIRDIINVKREIPYRNSKLTKILKDSIGGNAKTSIIATISQLDSNIEETKSTLTFAQNAKKIKNQAVINEEKLSEIESKIWKEKFEILKNNLNSAIKENNDLKSQFQKNIDKLMKDIEKCENENAELKNQKEKNDFELKLKEEEIQNKTKENDLLIEKNEELTKEINLLKEEINQNKTNIQNMINNHKNEILQKEENYKILLQSQNPHNDKIQNELTLFGKTINEIFQD